MFFSGDETRWDNIGIYEGNDPLESARIHFNSTGPDDKEEVTVGQPAVEERDGELVCVLMVCCPANQTAIALGARCDSAGRFLGIESFELEAGEDNELIIPFEGGSTIRVFALDGASFAPLCAPAAASAN